MSDMREATLDLAGRRPLTKTTPTVVRVHGLGFSHPTEEAKFLVVDSAVDRTMRPLKSPAI